MNLSSEEEWIIERIITNPSGTVTIRKPLIKKYRKMTGDNESSDSVVKDNIITRYQEYI